jgi:hypothetical protein
VGRAPYPAALRLVHIAAEHWASIDGEAAAHGIDYFALDFDRFLNVVQWWAVQRVRDPADFLAELDRPLGVVGRQAVTDRDLDEDARAFTAFASAFGVKPPTDASGDGDRDVPSASST